MWRKEKDSDDEKESEEIQDSLFFNCAPHEFFIVVTVLVILATIDVYIFAMQHPKAKSLSELMVSPSDFGQDCVLQTTIIEGVSLGKPSLKYESIEECHQKCLSTTGCKWISFGAKDSVLHSCRLMGGDIRLNRDGFWFSAPRECAMFKEVFNHFHLTSESQFPKNDFPEHLAASPDDSRDTLYGIVVAESKEKGFDLGDDFQTLAQLNFLPFVDVYVNRDYMFQVGDDLLPWGLYENSPLQYYQPMLGTARKFVLKEDQTLKPISLIANAFWSGRGCKTPLIHPVVKPTIISAHIGHDCYEREEFRSDWQRLHSLSGPFGASDQKSLNRFHKMGFSDSLMSLDLTLGLDNPWKNEGRSNEILLVVMSNFRDKTLTDSLYNQIPGHIKPNVRVIDHGRYNLDGMEQAKFVDRLQYCVSLLKRYAKAKFIITPLLHAAVPAKAMGTPVLFWHDNYYSDQRFSGYREFVLPGWSSFSSGEGFGRFDFENPKPVDISSVKDQLMQQMRNSGWTPSTDHWKINGVDLIKEAKDVKTMSLDDYMKAQREKPRFDN